MSRGMNPSTPEISPKFPVIFRPKIDRKWIRYRSVKKWKFTFLTIRQNLPEGPAPPQVRGLQTPYLPKLTKSEKNDENHHFFQKSLG